MKKILCGIAFVLAMTFATACGNGQQNEAVVEEEVVETVDSVAVEAPVEAPEVVAE